MNFATIRFPSGGYAEGRIIYAFKFADGSVYVGITGTSNSTGMSKPLRRLATHLRKSGNTFSILDRNIELANKGFAFSYSLLPDQATDLAAPIEQQIRNRLRGNGVKLLNGPETHEVPTPCGREQDVARLVNEFTDHVEGLSCES